MQLTGNVMTVYSPEKLFFIREKRQFCELVNYVFMIFCFGRVVSCVQRLDTNGFKFSSKPSMYRVQWTLVFAYIHRTFFLCFRQDIFRIFTSINCTIFLFFSFSNSDSARGWVICLFCRLFCKLEKEKSHKSAV